MVATSRGAGLVLVEAGVDRATELVLVGTDAGRGAEPDCTGVADVAFGLVAGGVVDTVRSSVVGVALVGAPVAVLATLETVSSPPPLQPTASKRAAAKPDAAMNLLMNPLPL